MPVAIYIVIELKLGQGIETTSPNQNPIHLRFLLDLAQATFFLVLKSCAGACS
jgi:hypothetical protein